MVVIYFHEFLLMSIKCESFSLVNLVFLPHKLPPLNVPGLKIQSNDFVLLFFQSGSSYFWNTVTNQVSWLHPLGKQIQAKMVLFEVCCFPMQVSQSAKFRYLFVSDPAAEITISASAASSQKGQFIIPKFCIRQVDEVQIFTVNRKQSWLFEH